MRNIASVLAGIIIAVFFLGSSAIYIVDQRQQAILFQLGEVIDVKTEPGLYFKIPLAQNGSSHQRKRMYWWICSSNGVSWM